MAYILKGRNDEANKALTFYRGQKYNIDAELAAIEKDVKKDKCITVCQQIKEPKYLKQLLVLTALHVLAMLCGNAVVIVYSTSIFNLAEIASVNSYLGTILSNIMRIIGLFIFLFISDKFSRKKLTTIFAVLSAMCMASLGIFFYLKTNSYDVSAISLIRSYNAILILRTGLLPTKVRAAGTAFLHTVFYVSNFITLFCYPYMIEYIGPSLTFWFYSLCSFFIAIVVIFFVSETKGKSLEEISKNNFKQWRLVIKG